MPLDVDHHHHSARVRGPAQPSYIFRGHTAQVHSVDIVRRNTCLLTGDADGWLVCWKLDTKRPWAVWKAHDAAILGTAEWGPERLITHGRDNTLRIWQLKGEHASYSTVLPADGADTHRPKPWLLHTLPVNTLNFCAFTMCYPRCNVAAHAYRTAGSSEPIYVAVPGRDDRKAEVYQFPDEKLICVVPRIESSDTGMVMALKLVHHHSSNNILVLAGYEGGFTAVHLLPPKEEGARQSTFELAQTIYLSQPHTQPVLSVDALPDGSAYFTSSADAIVTAHRIPELPSHRDVDSEPPQRSTSDEENKETPDAEELTAQREAASPTIKPSDATSAPLVSPAAISRSPEDPHEPLSFPKQRPSANRKPPPGSAISAQTSGISSLLASAPPHSAPTTSFKSPLAVTLQPAHKVFNTKHAGQQSLRVRSDGRLFVTGGWDSRVRIYSTKTLKEVAVLKWHDEGVYAVDFGRVLGEEDLTSYAEERNTADNGEEVVKRETGLAKLQRQREEAVQTKHWVAAGAKDGKVSLWEVF